MKTSLILLSLFFSLFLLNACSNNGQVTGEQARKILKDNANSVLVDVRTIEEYEENHIEKSILIPLDEIETITDYYPNKSTHIIVYCRSGNRSAQAVNILKQLGYKNVYDLGSIKNW